ncbi:deubiquitinase otu-like [Maniola hyperantus]|uniref:deubiquitinase otu-like n=1 Tax=Aphantopus hyperantus TaxID=2795564 RepID=UPI003747FB00
MSPSPIRCRGPWRVHKRSSEPDRWLDEMGFFRKHTARDASCLFRAVSEIIYNTQRYFHKVRMDCVQFMASHRHLFEGSLNCPFENYLREMSNPSEWGGLIEISAMSHLYRRDFVIFEANKGPQTNICNGYKETIYLFHLPDTKHFDVVHTKEYIHASSFCQSLVYEVLYDGVYQLKDLPYAVAKMLHDNVQSHHIEYFMSENVERRKKQKERSKVFIETLNEKDKDGNNNALALKCKHHTEDVERASLLKESLSILVFNRSLIHLENVCMNCLNVNSAKDLLDNGITPFPYKVAKALDPDIYRNIEFDVWSELRRELRYGTTRYYDGKTLQVGVKCRCKLHPEQPVPYNCHIQEMHPDGGPCLVFIEELGEKRVLNFDQLEPLPVEQIKPWAPPYRYSRANSQVLNLSQMMQQIGKITRKQGTSKARKAKSEETKPSEGAPCGTVQTEIGTCQDMTCFFQSYTYPHLDYMNLQPMPVEIQALPLMVDCRPAGAPPHEIAPPSNGAPPENHQNQQAGGSGDLVPQAGAAPAVRASTPATNVVTTYSANYNGVMNPAPPPVPMGVGGVGGVGYGCAPYPCGVKSVVWCGPHAPPPPPPGVNPHVYKSVQPNGADLPMNDIATLRFYFNLGVDCMWAAYGAQPQAPVPLPHPHPHAPPRHYSPRDISQDMQQISLHERGAGAAHDGGHKHKPQDKPSLNQSKGQGQRPLLGPRFKRGNNQDNNQNNNHNKGHNNNTPNKGPNNRRNSHTDMRAPPAFVPGANMGAVNVGAVVGDECAVEAPLVPYPYIPYPPPIYPVQYYPIESDPGMMGMMGGMGYVSYDDGVEYAPVQHFYPPPYPPPHLPEHK